LNDQQNQNEAACGGSALTAVLGDLADQFECHALSRSIDDIEAAGRAMRAAAAEISLLQKDAERYRWLRSREAECNVEIPDSDGYGYEMPGYEDELDAAIDAAMVPNDSNEGPAL
jgi:hypothetical protein